MRFDTIIIGGGLAGLSAGIRLQKAGQKTALLSAGQNALHFSSGSIELLAKTPDGEEVAEPLKALQHLDADHPYSKIGSAKMKEYVSEVKPFFAECGIPLHGHTERNSYRLTPTGSLASSWLAAEDIAHFSSRQEKIGNKALIVNIKGYIDFYSSFLADGLERRGTPCRIEELALREPDRPRPGPSAMHSVNIARMMDKKEVLAEAAEHIRKLLKDEDTVILPQVFGFTDTAPLTEIRTSVEANVLFAGTLPPSVPGIRMHRRLKQAYEASGGAFLTGKVLTAEVSESRVLALKTAHPGDRRLFARHFILATGGYFGKGLAASPDAVREPLFGLDVSFGERRSDWYDRDFFKPQNYMNFGVRTDACFRALKNGCAMQNLYAAGSVLGGSRALSLGCGGGAAILTAFAAADSILAQPEAQEKDTSISSAP